MQAAYWGGSHFASKPAIDRLVPPLPIDYSSNVESLCGVVKTFEEVRTILSALRRLPDFPAKGTGHPLGRS